MRLEQGAHGISDAGPEPRAKALWGDMSTGGSRGIRGSEDYVRRGGAAARILLMQAAAEE